MRTTMNNKGIAIESDFTDFYDIDTDNNSNLKYRRFRCKTMSRNSALKFIQGVGVRTIEVKPVSSFVKQEYPLVVYLDNFGHNGEGKRLISYTEGVDYFSNFLASKYLDNKENKTFKYLQLGRKRFIICYNNDEPLKLGKIDSVEEVPSHYTSIKLPMYSIDYISVDNELIATDFNEVESLEFLGLKGVIPKDIIINEIRSVLDRYKYIY